MSPWFALIAAVPLAFTTGVRASDATGPVVIELFTSQGCNSCPPADALLGELSRRPDVLALALHVTYWNDLGWADRFAQPQFDQRQRGYAQQLHLKSVYTPQMLVNGSRDVLGSQRSAVERALHDAKRPALIEVRQQGDNLVLELPKVDAPCDCVLTLFGVQPNARTPVGRGENAGRMLEEFQVARSMRVLGDWNGERRELQAATDKRPTEVSRWVVLAQHRSTGRVVAVGRL